MNPGGQTLDWLFREQLKVDEAWSERTPGGFGWWADRNAQTIEVVGQEIGPDGEVGDVIAVRTELLRDVRLGDRERAIINQLLLQFASMGGPVHDEDAGTLSLCSMVRVHDAIRGWMNPLISVAAVLQIGEARLLGPELARLLGAEQALSGPARRGLRPEPDEMAHIIEVLIAPAGRAPSRWSETEFQAVVDDYMDRLPSLLATAGGPGFTVEFPYGDGSSLCRAMADQPHPRYGNGLLLLQSFPVPGQSDSEGAALALNMNTAELIEGPFGYGFGSYAAGDGMLHFNCFLPNALYRRGLLPNLYYACAQRAREVSAILTGNDWT